MLGEAPYVLEVTSPGVSRPLTLPRHFRRNVGRLVALTLTGGGQAEGRLVAADPDGVRVRVSGDDAAGRALPYDQIERAGVRVEFSREDAAHDGAEETED